jgi:uncharacterized protein (DUF1810 family)
MTRGVRMNKDEGNDPFQLARFTTAQNPVYAIVRNELLQGRKQSHWMWFVFPQIDGLGYSPAARRYSIKSIDEARAYLVHPVLGFRLKECCNILLTLHTQSATEIFGHPDDSKLRSSMTLFAQATLEHPSVFDWVIDRFFGGTGDQRTFELLKENPGDTCASNDEGPA